MLSRRFRVGMNVGPPLHSQTGFAEGDAMSCVAMVVLNLAHHRYLSSECPEAQLLSYVDNWELIAQDARTAGDAYRAMETFTRVWDVELDSSKTQAWSTAPGERKALRAQGFKVIHNMRELGGHFQLTRAMTNATLTERIKELESMWPKLLESPAPRYQMMRAIAIPPRGPVASTGYPSAVWAPTTFKHSEQLP